MNYDLWSQFYSWCVSDNPFQEQQTDKYFNYGKKGYRFCEIGLMVDNLSEHQIEAL